jgi:hypothetical protein
MNATIVGMGFRPPNAAVAALLYLAMAASVAGATTPRAPGHSSGATLLPCFVFDHAQTCFASPVRLPKIPSHATAKVTGAIKELDTMTASMSNGRRYLIGYVVTVGGTTCSLTGREGLSQLSTPLVLGERVTLDCVKGQARSILLAP